MKKAWKGCYRLACLMGFFLWLAFVASVVRAEANRLETLEIGKSQGGVVLKMGFSQPLKQAPRHFSIAQPARIVFDFAETTNGLGFSQRAVNEAGVKSLNIVEGEERARLVLNLERMMRFEARMEGKQFIIGLNEAEGAALAQHFAGNALSSAQAIVRDIQFRRGRDGAGIVAVELSAVDATIDVQQKGGKLHVAFKKTKLPDHLRRRLDVIDFATPVDTVTARRVGEDVLLEIIPHGNWQHVAFQSDNQFIVEVRPVKEDPTKLAAGAKSYKGEVVSLNFQNIPLRELLHVFADITDFNIVVSDSVTGNVSLRLNDVPWDQALDIVLQQKNLAMRKSGNVLWIAPRDEMAARDKLEAEAREAAVAAEVPRLEVFQLNYQKAEDFVKLIEHGSGAQAKTAAGGFLSAIGRVTVDKRTNQIFVYDVPSKLAMIGELRAKVDKPPRQVLIEARIVEAGSRFSKTLGARLGLHDIRGADVGHRILGANSPRWAVGGNIIDPGVHSGQVGNYTPDFLKEAMNVNLPATSVGAATSQAGAFSLILFNSAKTQFLNLELSALEADKRGKIISSPRVVTANQVEALIEQGTEIPYLQASASGATNVAFKKAVLSLRVTPQITPDGRVLLKLAINKDAPSTVPIPGTVGTQIAIDTKKVETEVVVDNGGTVVIGGIFLQNQVETVQRIPFFGDLPVVGPLFRQRTKDDDSTELLVFITPKIVADLAVEVR
ncbi:MAG: type IV pilus secretin PilQ [Rhodocyclaceae bacterium]|nr:type IV pilus secretin PilQ [Rhodocyclaceae bacterium]